MVYVSFLYGGIHIWAIISTALDFLLTLNKPDQTGSKSFKFLFGHDKCHDDMITITVNWKERLRPKTCKKKDDALVWASTFTF